MAPPRLPRHGGVRRQITAEPITPPIGGLPPNFIVSCLDCEFACDEHAQTAEDAVQQVAPRHESLHHLRADAHDYSTHPLYGGLDANA